MLLDAPFIPLAFSISNAYQCNFPLSDFHFFIPGAQSAHDCDNPEEWDIALPFILVVALSDGNWCINTPTLSPSCSNPQPVFPSGPDL